MRRLVEVCVVAVLLSLAGFARADRLVLVAGGGTGADGSPAVQAQLLTPFGVDFNKSGEMFLVEYAGQSVRKVAGNGIVSTIAGTGRKGYSGDGGPALKAEFNSMHSLAVAPNGDIYVADTGNNCIRKIAGGTVSTIAGSGHKGYSGDDGPAAKAEFGGIYCVALDARAERLYLADLDNRRIRVIQLDTGTVTTVAGSGERGVPEDGALARTAPLVDPRAVAVDGKGNVYILERNGHALRVVDTAGKIRTVAGSGKKGFSGDGGDARQATLNGPKHLCIDRDDNVIIADTDNHVIRKYLPREGKIVRVAGTGSKGIAGLGGPPEQAELNQPHGVHVDVRGVLYIADSLNQRVVKIEP